MDNIRKTRFIQNGALIVDKMYSEKKLCELVEIMVKQKEEVKFRVVNRNFSKVSINFLNFSKKNFESKKFRTINF